MLKRKRKNSLKEKKKNVRFNFKRLKKQLNNKKKSKVGREK